MKTIQIKQALLAVAGAVSLFFVTACDEEAAWFPVKGNGCLVTETRVIPDFLNIRSSIDAHIIIVNGEGSEMELTAQQNILEFLETEVSDGTLFVSFGNRVIETDSTMVIRIYKKKISEIAFAGSGELFSEIGISSLKLSGTGTLKCMGETKQVSVGISGAGTIDLEEMKLKKADISISGNGNISLPVIDELNVSIQGIGVVYYKGSPRIEKNIRGTGQLIAKE